MGSVGLGLERDPPARRKQARGDRAQPRDEVEVEIERPGDSQRCLVLDPVEARRWATSSRSCASRVAERPLRRECSSQSQEDERDGGRGEHERIDASREARASRGEERRPRRARASGGRGAGARRGGRASRRSLDRPSVDRGRCREPARCHAAARPGPARERRSPPPSSCCRCSCWENLACVKSAVSRAIASEPSARSPRTRARYSSDVSAGRRAMPFGREHALHSRVRRDDRATRVGLRAEVVERLVEHDGEVLRELSAPRRPLARLGARRRRTRSRLQPRGRRQSRSGSTTRSARTRRSASDRGSSGRSGRRRTAAPLRRTAAPEDSNPGCASTRTR